MTSSSGFTTTPFSVYLVLDVAGDEEEAALLKMGDAHLTGSYFVIERADRAQAQGVA